MAASVENRQFVCIETDLATTARGLQSHISQRSNSSVMAFDFRPPSTTLEISIPNGVVPMDDPYEGFSSDDEHEREKQWKKALIHINSEVEPSICDPRDQGTSDHWIKRNPSLIRLTGKHPFNCEPPLNRLMHHGFLTPSSLHYVRNHGHVPKATWEEWKIEICGLIKRPATFTMNELVNNFQSHEFPVTLVCAGNRRKEQNMVKQSIGFNWGPAGISTSVWRGVLLRDVIQKVGISSRRHGALNVCFEGAEDLPGGGGSKYGTSIKREIAMDPSRDIIIAFMQNGELLSPDHGFPVRMIIPGFIGGRMVKWLKRIIVTTEESPSYYHFNDNRVLPSHVDAQLANEEGWWYQPEYIINELNINSVITTPGHEEILPINSSTTQRSYTFRGYAYSGGGRKVTRVELTLDGGDSWILCNLEHPEKPNRYGKYWCWCFWSLQIEVLDLLSAKEIAVRAWDEALNTQPQKLIWNLMGMMNNCWFKVKTNMCRPHKGEIGIVFEHPTQPANNPGGWMAKQKHIDALDGLKKSISTPFINISSNKYSMSEVKKHSTASSAWIVVNGHVYDCTKFIKDHPGGADSILINAGTDCSDEFDAIHSNKAKTMLEDYRIGEVLTFPDYSSDTSTSSSPSNSIHGGNNLATIIESSKHSGTLGTGQKIPCKLISKTVISHDVRLFRFALPSKDDTLGLPVGKHIFLCATIDGKLCIRAYTPTSSVDEVGYFDLLIKIYFRDTNPKFPNGGTMSQYLESLPMGATVDIKGPLGHIMYNGKGNFTVHGEHKHAKRLAMIAGGTGITPIYQVMQAILKDPEDDTEMFLVYANRTEDDILLRNELDEWGKKHKNVNIWYVVGEVLREKWKYSAGFITESILRDHVPRGSNDSLALICGPPPMIQFAVLPNLEKMNYDIKKSCLQF